ncbi:MAG TPA: TetR family transcriptional regulator [Micromonosporaceae bacterium]|nr:TetR family transcriptional regulator [Micromonosporaceae bacterium]
MSGLRERKKQQTREQIAAAAFELFASHGFDRVSVAAVARHAGVSEATVFNYFPTKEDLVIGRLDEFEAGLVAAVRDRPPGTSVIAAFGAFLTHRPGLLGSEDPAAAERLVAVNRIIAGSPAIQARERRVYDEHARALADVLAVGTRPGDLRPRVVATALIGVHRAVVEMVRSEVLAGRSGPALVRRVRASLSEALGVLDAGLATYPDGGG